MIHLADFCTASGAVQGSWMYRVGKFYKEETKLERESLKQNKFSPLALGGIFE